MRITSQSPAELVVKDSSVWLSALCAAVALGLILFGIAGAQPDTFVGAALFLLFGTIGARTTTFTFDAMQRVVRWSGYKPFKTASGTIPFDDISDITIEATSGGSDATTYRLSLLTSQGAVPMAYTYSGSSDAYASLRQKILGVLKPGLPAAAHDPAVLIDGVPADLESSIRSLLRQGRKIDAIAVLRSRRRIGLTEAVSRINAVDKKMKAETRPR